MCRISTITDLRTWVCERIGPYESTDLKEKIADAIRSRPDRPAWGKNWEPWLENLPENLAEILER